MKILTDDERYSTRIIRKLAAETWRIPETDADLDKMVGTKVAQEDCDCCECPEGKCDCGCRCANHTAKCATTVASPIRECESCGAQNPSNVTACASCSARFAVKTAKDGCPNCGQEMQKVANIRRCVCGFATTAEKPAKETGVAEYYRKIYPDAFVSEMTGDPKSIDDKNVSYEVEKSESKKVSSKDILERKRARERKRAEGLDGAGQTDVPDAHPESSVGAGSGSDKPKAKMITEESANSVSGPNDASKHGPGNGKYTKTEAPDLGQGKHKAFPRIADTSVEDPSPQSGVGAGSGATSTPDPSWQSGDSANSVSGPEKASGHGAGIKAPGDVASPDLGLPRGAKRKHAGGHASGCGCGFCKAIKNKGKGEDKGDDASDDTSEKDAKRWITREVMATLCPPCAVEMAKRGIKQVRAGVIAKMIAERAEKKGFTAKSPRVK